MENDWKQLESKPNLKVHSKNDDKLGLNYVRGECNIKASVSKVKELVSDLKYRK